MGTGKRRYWRVDRYGRRNRVGWVERVLIWVGWIEVSGKG